MGAFFKHAEPIMMVVEGDVEIFPLGGTIPRRPLNSVHHHTPGRTAAMKMWGGGAPENITMDVGVLSPNVVAHYRIELCVHV